MEAGHAIPMRARSPRNPTLYTPSGDRRSDADSRNDEILAEAKRTVLLDDRDFVERGVGKNAR